jgi:hypothetical protein
VDLVGRDSRDFGHESDGSNGGSRQACGIIKYNSGRRSRQQRLQGGDSSTGVVPVNIESAPKGGEALRKIKAEYEYAKIVGEGEVLEVFVGSEMFSSPRGSIDKSNDMDRLVQSQSVKELP